MKQTLLTLEHARRLTPDTWELMFSGDTSAVTEPGQFVSLALPGKFLRRPISVCSWAEDVMLLLVKEAGEGTAELVRSAPGTEFDVLTGLGSGFDAGAGGDRPLLIGGGIGLAPLFGLAQRLLSLGHHPAVALGFRTAADAFFVEEFAALGCPVSVATEDGSLGLRGFVTGCAEAMADRDYAFVCGPTPMLKAVHALPQLRGGQFSFEARMGCGFGACVGCSIRTRDGMKRVCRDGPVFRKEEILWQT